MSVTCEQYVSGHTTPLWWLQDWVAGHTQEVEEIAKGEHELFIGCDFRHTAETMLATANSVFNKVFLSREYKLNGSVQTDMVEADAYDQDCNWYVAVKCCPDREVLSEEDETVVTNEHGGSQSLIKGDWTQLPFTALDAMAKVMEEGAAKYGERNYRKIPKREHVNHALRHLVRYCDYGDHEDLTHAFTRLAFALDINEVDK